MDEDIQLARRVDTDHDAIPGPECRQRSAQEANGWRNASAMGSVPHRFRQATATRHTGLRDVRLVKEDSL
jgi:hypothetical protein